jgi:hypothetical protein
VDALKPATDRPMIAYTFKPTRTTIINKKAAEGATNRSWEEYGVTASALLDNNGKELVTKFLEVMKKDRLVFSQQCMAFMLAEDYDGLHGAPLDAKLAEYDEILK